MAKKNFHKFALLSALLLSILMTGTRIFVPTAKAMGISPATPGAAFEAADPPTPVEPAGTYSTNDLTYKWMMVSGATKYQYRVWDGETKMWDRTVSSTACDRTYCTHYPSLLDLIDSQYKWQVRAKVGGVWEDWSRLQWYSIKAGFSSAFNSDAEGWDPTYGDWTWDLYYGNYRTTGLYNKFSTSRFDQVYSVYTYEVKLRRQGSDMNSSYGILFNGDPWPLGIGKRWDKGYAFLIKRTGQYGIWRYDNGMAITIQNWTSSAAINTSWYNTLEVTYNKNTGYTQFFINGVRVAYGYNNTYKFGNVGVTMFKGSTGWEQMLVEYAILTISAPYGSPGSEAGGGIFIDEATAAPAAGDDTGY